MSQLFVDSIEPKTSGEVVSINRGKGPDIRGFSSMLVVAVRGYKWILYISKRDNTTSHDKLVC